MRITFYFLWLFIVTTMSLLSVESFQDAMLKHWNWSQTIFSQTPKHWISYVHKLVQVSGYNVKQTRSQSQTCLDSFVCVLKHTDQKISEMQKRYKQNPVKSVYQISSKSEETLDEDSAFASFHSSLSVIFPMAMFLYNFPLYREHASYKNLRGQSIFQHWKLKYHTQHKCSWEPDKLSDIVMGNLENKSSTIHITR